MLLEIRVYGEGSIPFLQTSCHEKKMLFETFTKRMELTHFLLAGKIIDPSLVITLG